MKQKQNNKEIEKDYEKDYIKEMVEQEIKFKRKSLWQFIITGEWLK